MLAMKSRQSSEKKGYIFVLIFTALNQLVNYSEKTEKKVFGTTNRKSKKPKKSVCESSKAVKAFLDEWAEAASDWRPGENIQKSLQELREAAAKCKLYIFLFNFT